jgi:hypothetical protein
MVLKPNRFQFIAKAAYQLRMIDKSMFRFTETQMNSRQKREQVYLSWIVFRKLKFNLDELAQHVNSNNTAVTVIIGKFDTLFPAEKIKRLLRDIKSCKIEVLESGHNSLIRKSIPLILESTSKS